MRLLKRQARVNGEVWRATYSPVEKDSSQTPEDDADFRFSLYRGWDLDRPTIMFVGVNPSTATHTTNDPTVRRCCQDAKRWGFGGMFMMNVFPYRATDPDAMKRYYSSFCRPELDEEVTKKNFAALISVGQCVSQIVCAWGNNGDYLARGLDTYREFELSGLVGKCVCYRITKLGEPEHPLYQKSTATLIPYYR